MRKIIIGIVVFILGIIISIIAESHFRHLIQHLYRVLTNDSIYFIGKDFRLFPSIFYCLGFGVWTFIVWQQLSRLSKEKGLLNGLLILGMFSFTLIILCYLDSNLKIMKCTMCDDGRRGLRYSEVKYDFLIEISLLISLLPILVISFLRKKGKSKKHSEVLDLKTEQL